MTNEKEIILFETEDKRVSFPVEVRNETVWISANQMASLFERDEKTIRKHVNNVFQEREVEKENNTQKMRLAGVTQLVPFYHLMSSSPSAIVLNPNEVWNFAVGPILY